MKIRVKSGPGDGARIGCGIEVLGEDGKPIEDVFLVEINPIVPGEAVTAKVSVFVSDLDLEADALVVEEEFGEANISALDSPDKTREYITVKAGSPGDVEAKS